jgi:hypothetical protein
MAEGVDIGGGGSFAKHLDDGVAGDEMDEKEDDGDDDPEDGQGEEDAAQRLPVVSALFRWRRDAFSFLRAVAISDYLEITFILRHPTQRNLRTKNAIAKTITKFRTIARDK